MGAPMEQSVMVIEAVGEAISRSQPVPPAPAPTEWWQVFAIIAGAIAALLTAWASYAAVKRKGK